MNNLAIIIPALNPTEDLIDYVKLLRENSAAQIIVVNDGSNSGLLYIFSQLNDMDGCIVLTHEKNQGKGKALKTAFAYFLHHFGHLKGVVTADADGQHSVEDVCAVAKALMENPQKMILGVRDFLHSDVPSRSLIGNRLTSFFFRLIYGSNLKDTQTGLRGISKENISWILNLNGDRYEYEINMLIYAKKNYVEFYQVPIQTLYFNNNSASHYHPILDSLKVFQKLIRGLLYYSFSTISSGIIDILVFILLSSVFLVNFSIKSKILYATVIARLISSTYNFYMNRHIVFRGRNSVIQSLLKYYLLCFGLILMSYTLVLIANIFLNKNLILSKICIDTFLGLVSYQFQLHWVFKKKKVVGDFS